MVDEQKEQVVRDGKLRFIDIWASQYGLLLWLMLGWNIGIITAFFGSKKWRLKITSQRIEFIHGISSVKQESFEFYRAQDSDYSQSIVQMLCGVGSVRIIGKDATTPTITFPTRKPAEVREQIRGFIREQRQAMGTIMRD